MDVNTRYILRISRNKTQTLMFWAWTTCGCPSFSLFGRATLSLSDQKFMDSTSAIAMFPQYFYCVTDRHKKIDVLSYLSFQNSTRRGMKSKWIFEAYPSERKVSFHGRNSQVENFDRISRITCMWPWCAAMQYLTCEALSHCVLPTETLCSSTTSTWDSHPKPEESSLTQIRINCFFIFVFLTFFQGSLLGSKTLSTLRFLVQEKTVRLR